MAGVIGPSSSEPEWSVQLLSRVESNLKLAYSVDVGDFLTEMAG